MVSDLNTHHHAELAAVELRAVLGRLTRLLRAAHSFSFTQGAVLGHLDDEGAMTTTALAAAENVRQQSMAQTVADLEAAGLVARTPDQHDRRQILIELTDRGREVLEEDRRYREGWLTEAIVEALSPREQALLARAVPLLKRLAEK